MQIGRRIYFDKATGNVIQDAGERSGSVVETTIDQDFLSYIELVKRVRDTVGVIELPYGAYAQDFSTCNGYKIDITTNKLVFTYPDPNNPIEAITRPSYEERLVNVENAITSIMGV